MAILTQYGYRFQDELSAYGPPYCVNGHALTFSDGIKIVWPEYESDKAPSVPDSQFVQAAIQRFGGWYQQDADRNAQIGYVWEAAWNMTEERYDPPVPTGVIGGEVPTPAPSDASLFQSTTTTDTTPPTASANDSDFAPVTGGPVQWRYLRSRTPRSDDDYSILAPHNEPMQTLVDSGNFIGRTILARAWHVSEAGYTSDWTAEEAQKIDGIPDFFTVFGFKFIESIPNGIRLTWERP